MVLSRRHFCFITAPDISMSSFSVNAETPRTPRILISYFFGADMIPLGASCANGLRELGWDVACFNSQVESRINLYFLKYVTKLLRAFGWKSMDVANKTPWNNDRFRAAQLERAVATFRPDVLLVIRGNHFDGPTLQRIKARYNVRKTVGWWVKDPRTTSEMIDDAKNYDYYFCIHRFGYGSTDRIAHLTALAVDRDTYHPAEPHSAKTHELVFVGGWSQRRQEMLQALSDLPLEIYGPGWSKLRVSAALRRKLKAPRIWGPALTALYGRSKIVLNVSSWDPQRTGLNLRTFDVPATGAFFLTDEAAELRNYFTPGVEIETFSSASELREKAEFYLTHDQQREDIAQRGYARVLGLETYTDKMRSLLSAIGEPVSHAVPVQ